MLATISSASRKLLKLASVNPTFPFAPRALKVAWFGTADKGSVIDAWNRSCYFEMDFTIPEDSTVYEAVEKFSAYDVGALVTTDKNGKFSGIISERDYVKKIALLGRKSKETKIKDIYVHSRNAVSVSVNDSVEKAMELMMTKSIRHLPIMDGDKLVGFVSIKDLIKEVVTDREKTIQSLSDLALGKGAGAV
mmetsp:Transcript_9523/g.17900  ORF Transcript_9523/g.17900 Transcript_9523/m.17900 type:complete len:192 (+) Transcript_9523:153-728(+)